uniref:Aminoglycoside phosphotransferase domain-containing protein n=1 Tax=Solibacter usitatus (strain Ellin6076) TaxID=234267 RepID=Q01SQ4_SOLUE
MPRILHYDPQRNVLVTELLPSLSLGGRVLNSVHNLLPEQVASAGETLARVHLSIAPPASVESQFPLGIALYKPGLELYRNSSRRNIQLLAALQSDETLCQHLMTLDRSWQRSNFIHGDVKLDNIVQSERDGRRISVLVDWEFAGSGDIRWDVGSVAGEILYMWIVDVVRRELGSASPPESDHRGTQALEQVRLLIAAFFKSYCDAAGKPFDAIFIGECFGFAAARLLQTTYEAGQYRSELDLFAVKTLQMAANIAANCDGCVRVFLDPGKDPGKPV